MFKPSTILVVDDSVTQLALLQDALEDRGYVVETAADGMEAISKVYTSLPSLVISDVMMPELNGYHLCRLLKSDPYTAHIPIILLTNLKERHDRFWGENAGADLYLEKGPEMEPLLREVASFLPPGAHSRLCPLSSPPLQLNSKDIRARITGILDRSLYDSTISNEVLKLTGLAHDTSLLAEEFFSFLATISRYSVAALLIREGRDKYVLCTQVAEAVSEAFLEMGCREILQRAGLARQGAAQVRRISLNGEAIQPPAGKEDFHVFQHLPILDGEELLASLTLFHTAKLPLPEGLRHALNIIADRLLIVMRYVRKFKEIEEVKADFVSMLVHDMRSPLTSIRGFTDVLAEGILGDITQEQTAALQNIQSGSDRLLHLIEDVLDLSKIEAGKMQLHLAPQRLEPLVTKVVKDLSGVFTEKQIDIATHLPDDLPLLLADGKQLTRVLANLLTNAAKFTPSAGRIRLAASPKPPFLQVSVTDTGPGIPPEQQKKLFQRYQQLPATAMFRKGTGLGLAICYEIVNLHGGDIWVESPVEDERGSRFSFTLPLA